VKAVVNLVWGLILLHNSGRIGILHGIPVDPYPPDSDKVLASFELKVLVFTQTGYNLDATIISPPTTEAPVL
jgi:hypothetical protein